jgi:hypothetical protein
LWHIDPLLGNDHETNNKTMAVDKQWPVQQWKYCWKRCFLYGPLQGYITRPTEFSLVSAV